MKDFNEIQQAIDVKFENYIRKLLNNAGAYRSYYYWTLDFFETIGGLSFSHFNLTDKQKDRINTKGDFYFTNSENDFSVNKNSHRNDIIIRNITKLYSSIKIPRQTATYEYVKEFIFWQLLISTETDLRTELNDARKITSSFTQEIIQNKTLELKEFSETVNKQENNFLFTYVNYLCSEHKNPIHGFLMDDFIHFPLTNQGEDLIKKIDEIDRDFIYDSKTGKEIKRNLENLNPDLRQKIERLYVRKKEEQKIHFLFSKNSGGDKEELRELLEVMGDEETGTLYRGQANSSWSLDSSMTREQKYLDNEHDMYYDILSLKPDAFNNDNSVYERLITMQHYGMPTRLLDITRNPLVAIFFACNNRERKDFDGTIFTFIPPEDKTKFLNFEDDKLECLPYLYNSIVPENKTKEEVESFLSEIWFIKGVAKNQRINSQSGDFIFVGNGKDAKEKLRKLPKKTIIIDSSSKEVLIQQLESLNIHGGAVYPDLTHMSNYIRNKYLYAPTTSLVSKTQETSSAIESKKEENTKPKRKNNTTIPQFDFDSIKEKSRDESIEVFSQFYGLKKSQVAKFIPEFSFNEKRPFRDEITKISNRKLSVLKDRSKIDLITDDLIKLSKKLGE